MIDKRLVPTVIRGVEYPSMSAAARALGVDPITVWMAAERGTLEFVGLGKGGPGRAQPMRWRPCWFRGKHYPSRTAAAKAHDVSVANVSASVRRAREAERQMAV